MLCSRLSNGMSWLSRSTSTCSHLQQRTLASYKKIKPGKILGRKTLRERIMSPEMDGVNVRLHLKIAGLSAAGLGIISYTGLKISERSPNGEKGGWPALVRNRIQDTYYHLAGEVAMVGIGTGVCLQTPIFLQLLKVAKYLVIPWAVSSALATGWLTVDMVSESNIYGMKHAMWAGHCALISAFLASVGGKTMFRAAATVATVTLGLCSCAASAPSKRFLNISAPLSMALSGVLASALTPWLAPSLKPLTPTMYPLYLVAVVSGVLLFYSVQGVVHRAETHAFFGGEQYDSINNAMPFVLDIAELFKEEGMDLLKEEPDRIHTDNLK